MSGDITPDQWMLRTPDWHLYEAAQLEVQKASYNSDQPGWAMVRKQVIQNHLLWALAKQGRAVNPE